MPPFKIKTRFQREAFAVALANQLKKTADPKAAGIAECIVHVLGAPIELVHRAVVKLLNEHPELGEALDLEVRR